MKYTTRFALLSVIALMAACNHSQGTSAVAPD